MFDPRWYLVGALACAGCTGDPSGADHGGPGGKADDPFDAGSDPALLSTQGVYADVAALTLPAGAIPYTVTYDLWSDGATKRRWLMLPPDGAPIDNVDQDHWVFPPGTRIVKEFTRDDLVVETRIVERLPGDTPAYSFRTYVWRDDGLEADLALDGATDVRGTAHDVPAESQCIACHQGEPGKVLGFSAIQVSADTLASLDEANRLTVPIAAGTTFGPTGDPDTIAALGYLHGNCGHCHNPRGIAGAFIDMNLQLASANTPAELATGYVTTVGVAVQFNGGGATQRIAPQDPANSAILRRISVRGINTAQMPLLATEVVDQDGIAMLTAWVESL
jgi:hypothetical protein